VAQRRQAPAHPRPRRRPDRGRHKGNVQDAEHNRGRNHERIKIKNETSSAVSRCAAEDVLCKKRGMTETSLGQKRWADVPAPSLIINRGGVLLYSLVAGSWSSVLEGSSIHSTSSESTRARV